MASIEDDRTGSAGRSASLSDCAVNGDDARHIAASIAQKLREAFLKCEIVNLFPVEAAVLRRDRTIVILALTLLSALAWSYVLWLSAGMAMGGMDMTGFRMIPSGTGLMVPTEKTVARRGVRIRVRHVDCHDGRHDGAVGSADGSHLCPDRPTN